MRVVWRTGELIVDSDYDFEYRARVIILAPATGALTLGSLTSPRKTCLLLIANRESVPVIPTSPHF